MEEASLQAKWRLRTEYRRTQDRGQEKGQRERESQILRSRKRNAVSVKHSQQTGLSLSITHPSTPRKRMYLSLHFAISDPVSSGMRMSSFRFGRPHVGHSRGWHPPRLKWSRQLFAQIAPHPVSGRSRGSTEPLRMGCCRALLLKIILSVVCLLGFVVRPVPSCPWDRCKNKRDRCKNKRIPSAFCFASSLGLRRRLLFLFVSLLFVHTHEEPRTISLAPQDTHTRLRYSV